MDSFQDSFKDSLHASAWHGRQRNLEHGGIVRGVSTVMTELFMLAVCGLLAVKTRGAAGAARNPGLPRVK